VEDIDLRWRTSSYSGNGGGNCIEVASHDGMILVRDTKQRGQGPIHRYARDQWRVFVVSLRDEHFKPNDPGRRL
jgi:hypothetical protein